MTSKTRSTKESGQSTAHTGKQFTHNNATLKKLNWSGSLLMLLTLDFTYNRVDPQREGGWLCFVFLVLLSRLPGLPTFLLDFCTQIFLIDQATASCTLHCYWHNMVLNPRHLLLFLTSNSNLHYYPIQEYYLSLIVDLRHSLSPME